jgi:hypothetical protein
MSTHQVAIARYQELRAASRRLHSSLARFISMDALRRSARKLGITFDGRTLSLEAESEADILCDYCIYDFRELARGKPGRNAIERLMATSPPPEGSIEMVLLRAMLEARYGLFRVMSLVEGLGVELNDVFRKRSFVLTDLGLSQSAFAGMLLAGRVIAPDGVHMTTGSCMPVGDRDTLEDILDALEDDVGGPAIETPEELSVRERARMSAAIIRACLANDASQRVAFA